MKLSTITRVVVAPVPRDSYVVEVQSMQGAGDGYTDFTVGPFRRGEHEANLQNLLETLKRMEERFPNGLRADTYRNILGFEQWFGSVEDMEGLEEHHPELLAKFGAEAHQKIINLSKDHYSEWHNDATCGYQSAEKLTKYEVFYHDPTGAKFSVKVDWED
jgi:hypothetical protein